MFLKADRTFGRVYFADLVGRRPRRPRRSSARCSCCRPRTSIVAPLVLWLLGRRRLVVSARAAARRSRRSSCSASLAFGGAFRRCRRRSACSTLARHDYKGVAYARKFPDSQRVYRERLALRRHRGLLAAPTCISRRACPTTPPSTCPTMPANAYLGLYIDGDGPIGIIRDLPAEDTAYFRFLPMYYPYVIKKNPNTFVIQFGGGISTARGAAATARRASPWPKAIRAVLDAFRDDPALRTSPATCCTTRGPRHRLRRPPLPRPHRRALRRHRPEPRRFGRPVEPRRLRDRREIRLHARGDGRPTCAR